MDLHDNLESSAGPRLLAVSFSYPPLVYPRSVQVARLLGHVSLPTVLVCADQEYYKDFSQEPDPEAFLQECLRVPFLPNGWRRFVSKIAQRFRLPLWNKSPDEYRSWKALVLQRVEHFTRINRYVPDVLITFGQPMTDHLIGLELHQRYRLPWVAHFSDPWVDNPFNKYDSLTRAVNISLERKVMKAATRLIFTSRETLDLVMLKYPSEWREKAQIVPHSFDPQRYPLRAKSVDSKLIVRYIGVFYGHRTPKPLFDALRHMASRQPSTLADVRFELIGWMDDATLSASGVGDLSDGLVSIQPPVNYQESLSLMVSADGLVLVDAQWQNSIFLPSKLIDYIGAGRPILGITPRGTAATLIDQLGGWVADSSDVTAMAEVIAAFLSFLRGRRADDRVPWGDQNVRNRYEVSNVSEAFKKVLQELLG
jgi:glycosyltransferase involved in cell wall biosynthesis